MLFERMSPKVIIEHIGFSRELVITISSKKDIKTMWKKIKDRYKNYSAQAANSQCSKDVELKHKHDTVEIQNMY